MVTTTWNGSAGLEGPASLAVGTGPGQALRTRRNAGGIKPQRSGVGLRRVYAVPALGCIGKASATRWPASRHLLGCHVTYLLNILQQIGDMMEGKDGSSQKCPG